MSETRVFYFSVRLLSNVIISQSSASAGDHQCLDYIPGGSLLGIAASTMYSRLTPEQAQQVFHSNAVRFGDALPFNGVEGAWPIPLCWHQVKGADIYVGDGVNKRVDEKAIFDPSRKNLAKNLQPKQLRAGHITADGQMLLAEKDHELKTAINAKTGAAAESQLFTYQSLKAGQVFAFSVTVDGSIADELTQLLQESLCGKIRLGRSRSAQFGEALIEPLNSSLEVATESNSTNELRLWLLSDLALLDDYGNALLQPTAESLGLPEGSKWEVSKSFIRPRSYTPFNAKRRCYDLERQVISRGSVLVFSLSRELKDEEIEALRFVGLYQNAGLGHVAVNPSLLATEHPNFKEFVQKKVVQSNTVKEPTQSLLIRVLKQKSGIDQNNDQIEKMAKSLVDDIKAFFASASNWDGLAENYYFEQVGRSQWGQIRTTVQENSKDLASLEKALFDEQHGIIRKREGQEVWSYAVNTTQVLADKMKQAIQDLPKENLARILAHACTMLMSNKSTEERAQGEQA